MKKCIWCSKTENTVSFNKKAHTIPKSLGGIHTCENVCDNCNEYFGNKESGLPSIEIAIKDILNLSKYLILTQDNNKPKKRFTSEYFKFNIEKKTLKFQPKYQLKNNFQSEYAKRFKRGIYKIFLEERERQCGDAHDDRFNYIREFARFGFNDHPIYFQKPNGFVMYNMDDIINPEIRFTDYSDEIDKNYRFYSYPIIGHSFVIPTSNQFMEERLKEFKKLLIKEKNPFGVELIEIKKMEDLDFRFNYLNT